MRSFLLAALGMMLTVVATAAGQAPSDVTARAVSSAVREVTTSGTWSAGGRTGSYRVVVLAVPRDGKTRAEVHVQWLASTADGSTSEIVESKPLAAFNELGASTAEVTLDSEQANEATLLVQSYNPEQDSDQSIQVRLGGVGEMSVVPVADLLQ